jgi:hypothetical protein
MDRGFFGHAKDNVYRPDGYVFPVETFSVVANDGGVAPNNDGYDNGGFLSSSFKRMCSSIASILTFLL